MDFSLPTETAVLLCGRQSEPGLDALADDLRAHLPGVTLAHGALLPDLDSLTKALDDLVDRGAGRIICLPALLSDAVEIKSALADVVQQASQSHKTVDVTLARELAIDAHLLHASRSQIEAAEATFSETLSRADTLLLVVGRGSPDPDLNSNLMKVTRLLWEGLGFGWAETAFIQGAVPSVSTVMEKVSRLGFQRTIVFPYLLLDDPLSTALLREVSDKNDLRVSGTLNDVSSLSLCLLQRLKEAAEGPVVMNCQLCSYREQVLGQEARQSAKK